MSFHEPPRNGYDKGDNIGATPMKNRSSKIDHKTSNPSGQSKTSKTSKYSLYKGYKMKFQKAKQMPIILIFRNCQTEINFLKSFYNHNFIWILTSFIIISHFIWSFINFILNSFSPIQYQLNHDIPMYIIIEIILRFWAYPILLILNMTLFIISRLIHNNSFMIFFVEVNLILILFTFTLADFLQHIFMRFIHNQSSFITGFGIFIIIILRVRTFLTFFITNISFIISFGFAIIIQFTCKIDMVIVNYEMVWEASFIFISFNFIMCILYMNEMRQRKMFNHVNELKYSHNVIRKEKERNWKLLCVVVPLKYAMLFNVENKNILELTNCSLLYMKVRFINDNASLNCRLFSDFIDSIDVLCENDGIDRVESSKNSIVFIKSEKKFRQSSLRKLSSFTFKVKDISKQYKDNFQVMFFIAQSSLFVSLLVYMKSRVQFNCWGDVLLLFERMYKRGKWGSIYGFHNISKYIDNIMIKKTNMKMIYNERKYKIIEFIKKKKKSSLVKNNSKNKSFAKSISSLLALTKGNNFVLPFGKQEIQEDENEIYLRQGKEFSYNLFTLRFFNNKINHEYLKWTNRIRSTELKGFLLFQIFFKLCFNTSLIVFIIGINFNLILAPSVITRYVLIFFEAFFTFLYVVSTKVFFRYCFYITDLLFFIAIYMDLIFDPSLLNGHLYIILNFNVIFYSIFFCFTFFLIPMIRNIFFVSCYLIMCFIYQNIWKSINSTFVCICLYILFLILVFFRAIKMRKMFVLHSKIDKNMENLKNNKLVNLNLILSALPKLFMISLKKQNDISYTFEKHGTLVSIKIDMFNKEIIDWSKFVLQFRLLLNDIEFLLSENKCEKIHFIQDKLLAFCIKDRKHARHVANFSLDMKQVLENFYKTIPFKISFFSGDLYVGIFGMKQARFDIFSKTYTIVTKLRKSFCKNNEIVFCGSAFEYLQHEYWIIPMIGILCDQYVVYKLNEFSENELLGRKDSGFFKIKKNCVGEIMCKNNKKQKKKRLKMKMKFQEEEEKKKRREKFLNSIKNSFSFRNIRKSRNQRKIIPLPREEKKDKRKCILEKLRVWKDLQRVESQKQFVLNIPFFRNPNQLLSPPPKRRL